jgi:hypothetical protein
MTPQTTSHHYLFSMFQLGLNIKYESTYRETSDDETITIPANITYENMSQF